MVNYDECISGKEVIILFENEICPFVYECKNANLHCDQSRCWGTREDRKEKFICKMKDV